MADRRQRSEIDFSALHQRLARAEQILERDLDDLTGEQRGAVLTARAKALAVSREQSRVDGIDALAFRVGGERYALEISHVDQVGELKQLSPLPGLPRHVLGAVAARSRLIVVFDLRQLLGLAGGGMSDLVKVVVVSTPEGQFGLAAEEVDGRMDLPKSHSAKAVVGPFQLVTSDGIALIDLPALIAAATRDD